MPREAAFAPFRLPYERKHPSRSFVAVLLALDELGYSYSYEISKRTGVDEHATARLLARMYRQYLVDREREDADPHELGRPLRTYYAPAQAGRELAEQLRESSEA
jgi:DNA-binding MarR family transcriptional regulator